MIASLLVKDLPLKLVEMEGEFAAWHACLEAIVIRLFIHQFYSSYVFIIMYLTNNY